MGLNFFFFFCLCYQDAIERDTGQRNDNFNSARWQGLVYWLCHLAADWPWAGDFTSLFLNLLTCKMKMMVLPGSQCCCEPQLIHA